ncbi:MAG: holo-[acyl-carrier-protein] synthase [Dehalococcoidia bacterium]|nr:MAG: holo-[acyl-carrier-protein] synthase [Dehalococcoidia bacterium]
MHYIGVDIIEIARIEKAIACWGERFLHRVYTDSELKLYPKQPLSLAARFAGKEAVIKALGGRSKGFSWREIEILSDPRGKPLVHLYGNTQNQADALGLDNFAISLSDCEEYAIAFVVGETSKVDKQSQ